MSVHSVDRPNQDFRRQVVSGDVCPLSRQTKPRLEVHFLKPSVTLITSFVSIGKLLQNNLLILNFNFNIQYVFCHVTRNHHLEVFHSFIQLLTHKIFSCHMIIEISQSKCKTTHRISQNHNLFLSLGLSCQLHKTHFFSKHYTQFST
jgi:hypothetical protein